MLGAALWPDPKQRIGIAIPKRLGGAGCLLPFMLPALMPTVLAQAGQIDLLVHDSLHAARNVRLRAGQRPGGLAARWLSMISTRTAVMARFFHTFLDFGH